MGPAMREKASVTKETVLRYGKAKKREKENMLDEASDTYWLQPQVCNGSPPNPSSLASLPPSSGGRRNLREAEDMDGYHYES